MAGAQDKAEEPITAINVTPLVDVCLVLVIIFMAIAPMALSIGINVLQSRAGVAQGKASLSENVQVRLMADGRITVNGAEVAAAAAALESEILKALAASKDKLVVISADASNKVGEVVRILDTAQQAGALKLAILKSEEQPGGKA
ncbi:MAG: biopolymer transporter ExbD [Elusimicrobia bacterium]|nr:biopolymer transporter ExbD [Elusimicrobiota bacterium]